MGSSIAWCGVTPSSPDSTAHTVTNGIYLVKLDLVLNSPGEFKLSDGYSARPQIAGFVHPAYHQEKQVYSYR